MDYETAFDLALSSAAHLAPDSGGLTVAQAHREMRRHRDCTARRCEMKALAVQTLTEAGRLQPAGDYDKFRG
jgi:hypothetical protein